MAEAFKYGPNLLGVVGREKTTDQNYDDYSPWLKAVGGTWTVPELNGFVALAVDYLPGTTMWHVGMPDVKDRADLIAFLMTRN